MATELQPITENRNYQACLEAKRAGQFEGLDAQTYVIYSGGRLIGKAKELEAVIAAAKAEPDPVDPVYYQLVEKPTVYANTDQAKNHPA